MRGGRKGGRDMGGLTLFAIRQARFTWLVIVATVIAGIAVYMTQPRQEDPEIAMRNAQVITRMPGLSPERIEQLITRPVEEQIKTIPEIKEIKSISMTGISIVSPEAADQYTDMAPIWAKLRNKMDDLQPRLPDGADTPFVNDDYGRVSVITLALSGPDFTMRELFDVSRDIRDALNTLPLVASVELHGVQQERIWIEFKAAALSHFGVDPANVVASLRGQNVVLPAGAVEANRQNIVIEPTGDFKSVEDIRRVAIPMADGELVYLEDLADIRRGYVDPPEAPAFYNNRRAIVIGISMVSKSNVVELGEQVKAALQRIRGALPLGMALDVVIFQPDLVQASVNSASENLLQTVAVVLAVVMIFLGLRTGLIVGSMVPLTMMATLIGMSVLAIELHRVSIAAIIVALGLLVDNGVVIAEDIRKRLDEGEERFDAALATPKSLAVPLLTSSITTIAAFLPLMMIQGGSGEFLRSLGQVLTLALLSSWLIGITVIPAFCYWFLPKTDAGKGKAAVSDGSQFDAAPYRFYRGFLNTVLRFRLLFVIAMIALLYSSTVIFSFVKQRSLGPSERNQFTVYVDLPAQASIRQTIDVTRRISAWLRNPEANPEVTDVIAYVGSGGPRFFLALSPNDPQPNKAFMVVNTQEADQIGAVMARVERFLVTDTPEASGRADILFLGPAPLGTVELRVTGEDIETLRRLGAAVESAFHTVPGVRSVRNDWENAVLKVRVNVDQERARRAGVTSEEIAKTLSAYFDGMAVTTFREGDQVIPVVLRADAEDRATLDRLRTVEIYAAARGVPVPLIQVADLEGEVEASRIRRFNQKRALTVAGKHPEMTAVELYEAMRPALDAIDMPDGYALAVTGEIEGSKENNQELFKFAPHALFIILALLILQFNSFRRTAIILLTIPLVLIGANYGLFVFKGFFDFTAMLGLFSLAGIIINNGIVLIDRIEEQRAAGVTVNEAIMEAALSRARPIIMTTVTTVVGLIPLAISGGEFWYGMAIVIMCGIAVGTVLTLGFVPVLYSLFFRGNASASANARAAREASVSVEGNTIRIRN